MIPGQAQAIVGTARAGRSRTPSAQPEWRLHAARNGLSRQCWPGGQALQGRWPTTWQLVPLVRPDPALLMRVRAALDRLGLAGAPVAPAPGGAPPAPAARWRENFV